jgi:hypothetical protein
MLIIYLHLTVFVLSSLFLFSWFIFAQDWPFFSSIWYVKVLAWSTLLYPIIFVIALILWKFVNPKFFYLPCINLVIGALILCYFLGYILLTIPKTNKAISEIEDLNITKNTEELENAPRDFVCNDKTFFSLDREVFSQEIRYVVHYYNTFFMEHLEKTYSSAIGTIDDSGRSSLQPRGDINEKEEQIWQKLNTCKNKDGKALLEIYPEK